MSTQKPNCGCVKGVGCDVKTCKYNDVDCACCTADHINVQNKTAQRKSETFCDTYTPKTSF